MNIKTHKDLIAWRKSMDLVFAVYKLTDSFPKSETYGLASQIKKSAISIPSNIAEGRRRGSKKEFGRFLFIAFGSGAELETQIEIVKGLPFGESLDYSKPDKLLDEVMRILNKMTSNIQTTT